MCSHLAVLGWKPATFGSTLKLGWARLSITCCDETQSSSMKVRQTDDMFAPITTLNLWVRSGPKGRCKSTSWRPAWVQARPWLLCKWPQGLISRVFVHDQVYLQPQPFCRGFSLESACWFSWVACPNTSTWVPCRSTLHSGDRENAINFAHKLNGGFSKLPAQGCLHNQLRT